jgi:hypothetical protein
MDDEPDYALDMWAGVVPARTSYSVPEPDARLKPGTPLPAYFSKLR